MILTQFKLVFFRYFFSTSGLYFLTVGRQERGVERGGDIRQMSPGPGLEPGTAASRTAGSIHGHTLNPYTISAVPVFKLVFVASCGVASFQVCGDCFIKNAYEHYITSGMKK
ncbi:hypothetical protein ATANTOWER_024541 [Ataeniobius toweri]|uniref:Uncharacterized protein n=1 Tax=Ataeniobius toweri TaxID=208326 RepID=A0ABU7C3L9_9TELE|nr:hypothetical protein [Ataeniobius toweri]